MLGVELAMTEVFVRLLSDPVSEIAFVPSDLVSLSVSLFRWNRYSPSAPCCGRRVLRGLTALPSKKGAEEGRGESDREDVSGRDLVSGHLKGKNKVC